MEFAQYPFRQLESPVRHDGVNVDSVRDIAANKLAAMLDRFEPKDFVDLFFLLQKYTLHEVKTDAEKKFGLTISPLWLGSELMKVKRIEALPIMAKPLLVKELQTFFIDLARSLKREVIAE